MFEVDPSEIRAGDVVLYEEGGQLRRTTATSAPHEGRLTYPVELNNWRSGYCTIYLSQVKAVERQYEPGDWKY